MDVLGPRALIGILVPSFNTVMQPELEALRPEGVTNHVARFGFDANLLQNVKEEAMKLATGRPSALIVGLATDGIPGGLAVLESGAADLSAETGLPVLTATHATHAALRALDVRRIGLVTPFSAEENEQACAAFADSGFDVIAHHGFGCPIDRIGETPLSDIRAAFAAVDGPEVEALVQVGTGLPVVGLIDELERAREKPVVACNAASYWQALRAVGLEDRKRGFGALLADH